MENTAIQAVPPSVLLSPVGPAPQVRKVSAAYRVLKVFASLRITVVLFALSIILVFCGTLAQVDAGIWTIVNQYFRSAVVWVPLQIFFPRTLAVGGGFPFPGGWLLGGLLLVNLLAAHAIRFKMTWKRSGIFLIHAGLIVMMLSELVAGLMAVESKMPIAEGEMVNYIENSREIELAVIDSSKPKSDDVLVIPEAMLRREGVISSDMLPFDVDVLQYMNNSNLLDVPPDKVTPDTLIASDSRYYTVGPRSEEAGVDPGQREDAAAVRVVFRKKGSAEVLATHMLSLWFYPNYTLRQLRFPAQEVTANGTTYRLELRYKRVYQPFSLHLIEFRHDKYLGTDKPKNFSSRVRLQDPARGEDREVTISMNDPLRYSGETFYQSGFFPDNRGTVLQVVRNPGWLMPYISCAMVSLGMIIHFGLHLLNFLRLRAAL